MGSIVEEPTYNRIYLLLSNIQKNRKMKFLLFLSCVCYAVQGEFILKSVNMNAQAFKEAQAHNLQSISNSAAGALRDFMTKNHVAFAVDGGEVRLTETYPNEGIPTGHSCKVTAEARDVHATAYMIPKSAELSPVGVVYDDISKNSFAIANVKHAMSVTLNIRATFGQRVFGHCHHVGRKTCGTDGYAEGTNHITAILAASNAVTECIAGQQHLSFNFNAKVLNTVQGKTYGAVQVGKHSGCNLSILGINIGSINSKVQAYANRYVHNGDRFSELRGPKLLAELERKLGVKMGSIVTLRINDEHGAPRKC